MVQFVFNFAINKQSDTYRHRPTIKNVIFRLRGISKRVNPSKSPLRKFDPKTILSLLIGERK